MWKKFVEPVQIPHLNYLYNRKYEAATQDDLWATLTTQAQSDDQLPSEASVKDIMDPWTLQMGYPYISVSKLLDGNVEVVQVIQNDISSSIFSVLDYFCYI